jgi:SAM-dependent methyltransferase
MSAVNWYDEERDYHDREAAAYAAGHRDILFWQLPESLFLFPHAVTLAGRVVLDVGCGAATSPARFIGPRDDCLYIGVDISAEMLRYAAHNMPRGVFVRTDTTRLPLRDGGADVLLSLGFLHHLPDPYALVPELARVHSGAGPFLLREPSLRAFRQGQGASPNEEGLEEGRFWDSMRAAGYVREQLIYLNPRASNWLRRRLHNAGLTFLEHSPALMRGKIAIDRALDGTLGRVLPQWFHGLDFFAVARVERPRPPARPEVADGSDPLDHALTLLACPRCSSVLQRSAQGVSCCACSHVYELEGQILYF